MGDSEPSRKEPDSAPQWQQKSPPAAPGATQASTASATSASRTELLEQASKFLEAGEIREAPTSRKIAFLESKGLTNEEIQKLLGVSRNTHSSTSNEAASPAPQIGATQPPSRTGATPSPQQPSRSSQPKRDVPPIVTYPEFLLPSPGPPPLLTARRLFTTLYLAGAAAASILCTSKYIIAPMAEQLTEARHSLGETAISNLGKFNEKLENAVSEVPPAERNQPMRSDDGEDTESVDSDPTECFHVDVGTQTSPSLSRRSSIAASESEEIPDRGSKVATQERRLKSLHSRLSELVEDNNDIGQEEADVMASIQDLKTHLHGLTYSSPYYSNNLYMGLGGSGVSGGGVRGAEGEDASVQMKSEIRGIKSVLLNAKNFPATSSSRGGLGAARAGAAGGVH
ncbi:hypothetical protein GP486_005348 [Trichoglossum hirsutum]|uniref:Peroxisomal membrane protein PEX14 n=1 Tax=Trichoglossum hirsutum TaxID=265104 RepID=A0A9P8L9C9_9PEZI|nr:hypothetical protein GP486_005348 [Trichoglossum hirsutum]